MARWVAVALAATTGMAVAAAPAGASNSYASLILSLHPRAYWQLGELSGTTAFDSSPHHHNGIYQGGPMLGQPGPITGDPTTAAEFNGAGQDVKWPTYAMYSGPFTVVAWINNLGTTGSAGQTFFDTRTKEADWGFDFTISHGKLQVDVGNGWSWLLSGQGIPYTFTAGTWYQVAAVVKMDRVGLYVDGTWIGTERYTSLSGTPLLYDRGHQVYLGRNPIYANSRFFGLIGQVAIFLSPLTATTINAIYQTGVSP